MSRGPGRIAASDRAAERRFAETRQQSLTALGGAQLGPARGRSSGRADGKPSRSLSGARNGGPRNGNFQRGAYRSHGGGAVATA
ncbi:MAG: hypothetical protein WAP35_00625, partial [Solirubrobacterales bacterium]